MSLKRHKKGVDATIKLKVRAFTELVAENEEAGITDDRLVFDYTIDTRRELLNLGNVRRVFLNITIDGAFFSNHPSPLRVKISFGNHDGKFNARSPDVADNLFGGFSAVFRERQRRLMFDVSQSASALAADLVVRVKYDKVPSSVRALFATSKKQDREDGVAVLSLRNHIELRMVFTQLTRLNGGNVVPCNVNNQIVMCNDQV